MEYTQVNQPRREEEKSFEKEKRKVRTEEKK